MSWYSAMMGLAIVGLLAVIGLWCYAQSERDTWDRNQDDDPWNS